MLSVRAYLRSALCLTLLSMLVPAMPATAENPETWPARGYKARGCGFDMNRNGVFGEPEDCRVCDGVTTDPDDDKVDEDIFYVDCENGVNNLSCGSPGSPCRTIEYAWNTRGNGPGDGEEDIICFTGVCDTLVNFSPQAGGVPSEGLGDLPYYVVPRSGSQGRDWQYPRNPTMLVGWDVDGDGVYPPVDPGETSVLDGAGLSRPFRLDSDTDYLEMAHFAVRFYGVGTNIADSGFVRFGPSGGTLTHQYFHDLRLNAINRGRRTTSETILINLFPTNAVPQWLLFDNLEVQNNGQWFARGAGYDGKPDDGPDMGPFRFINITRTSRGCDFSDCGSDAASTSFKLWGYMTGIEILDSVWDANVDAWEPKPNGGPPGTAFVFVDVCSQDWLVRNNEVIDHKLPFRIKGYSGADCIDNPRSVTDVVFDANIVRNTYEPYRTGDHGVRIEPGGGAAGEWVENVWITNNFMSSSHGWEAAIWSYAGHNNGSSGGEIVIANNTFYGDINRHAAIVLGNIEGSDQAVPHQDYVIENNIIGGFEPDDEADLAIYTTFNATGLDANYNVFDVGAQFVWNDGPRRGLSGWRTVSGEDGSSRLCDPLLVNPAAGNFFLEAGDPCARDRGVLRASTPDRDVDGNERPQGTLDIGADELGTTIFCDGFENGLAPWSVSVP